MPDEGETVVEDEEDVDDDDSVGDDSAIGVAEVVAEVLKGGRVDGKTDGLMLSNFTEDSGEVLTDNPGPAMNILMSASAGSSKSIKQDRYNW